MFTNLLCVILLQVLGLNLHITLTPLTPQSFNKFFLQILYSGKAWQREILANLAKLFVIYQAKTIQLVLTINNLLADLLICQTFC